MKIIIKFNNLNYLIFNYNNKRINTQKNEQVENITNRYNSHDNKQNRKNNVPFYNILKTSNPLTIINYQDMMGFEKNLPMPAELIELPVSGEKASESGMEVMIRDVDDANTDIFAEFSGNRFKAEDITRFVEMMISVINDMIKRREKLDTTLERLFEGLGWELPRR